MKCAALASTSCGKHFDVLRRRLRRYRGALAVGVLVLFALAALSAYGPTTLHRRSWVFMDSLPWTAVRRYDREAHRQPALF